MISIVDVEYVFQLISLVFVLYIAFPSSHAIFAKAGRGIFYRRISGNRAIVLERYFRLYDRHWLSKSARFLWPAYFSLLLSWRGLDYEYFYVSLANTYYIILISYLWLFIYLSGAMTTHRLLLIHSRLYCIKKGDSYLTKVASRFDAFTLIHGSFRYLLYPWVNILFGMHVMLLTPLLPSNAIMFSILFLSLPVFLLRPFTIRQNISMANSRISKAINDLVHEIDTRRSISADNHMTGAP